MRKCVIFDLDGTLLSTLESIRYHLNKTLASYGFMGISLSECSEFIGNGARLLVSRAAKSVGVTDGATIDNVLRDYNESYNSDPIPKTEIYPGVKELVDELYLSGIVLGVVTNKPEPTAKQLIEHFFPNKFSFVRGGRAGVALKPDPKDSLDALGSVGSSPDHCVFVGDTPVDVSTAKNIGAALCVGVSWGFRSAEILFEAGADCVVDDAMKILDLVDGVAL